MNKYKIEIRNLSFLCLDVNEKEWKEHKKHIFILSEAGKPIYSRLVYSEF